MLGAAFCLTAIHYWGYDTLFFPYICFAAVFSRERGLLGELIKVLLFYKKEQAKELNNEK